MPTRIELKTECTSSINLLIQNCCDPLIQEIISFDTPDLPPIGGFLDFDGNCWKFLGTTTNPVNSIRGVSNSMGNCAICVAWYECPENLVVESCCATFETIFSSTLPGIGIGDTFSDDFGFCWTVTGTTVEPINGVVSVGTVYPSIDCTTCLGDNICPDIYAITSCCKNVCDKLDFNLYTTLALLGGGLPGETFEDQFGFCWRIADEPVETFTLLTGSFIQYVASAGPCGIEDTPCYNACNNLVMYTIQNCLTLETEVVQHVFGLTINQSTLITFTIDMTPRCYKIISWDNVSLATKEIDAIEDCFRTCEACLSV